MTVAPPLRSAILSLEQLFLGRRFRPAPVQRDYQWVEDDARALLGEIDKALVEFDPELDARAEDGALAAGLAPADDEAAETAEAAGSEPAETECSETPPPSDDAFARAAERMEHFYLGDIVARPARDAHEVFDGMQRLTTLTILFAVLRDLVRDEALSDALHRLVADEEGYFRLMAAGSDGVLAERVQPRGEAGRRRQHRRSTAAGERAQANTRLLRARVRDWPVERREAYARFLMSRVWINLVETDSPRLARNVFVTTNLYGAPLEPVDLFKGQLADLAGDAEQAERVIAAWDAMAERLGKSFPEFVMTVETVSRAHLLSTRQLLSRRPGEAERLSFLRDLLAISGAPALGWLEGVERYAKAWEDMWMEGRRPGAGGIAPDIWRLRLFKWKDWRPLALFWRERMQRLRREDRLTGAAETALRRNFDLLHRRCMAVDLNGYSDGARETIFLKALKQAVSGRRNPVRAAGDGALGALTFDLRERLRIDDRLRQHLDDPEDRSTLMRWVEASFWEERIPAYLIGASVEHVLPQRPERDSQWLRDFPEPQRRENACHSIGNLAVMDGKMNPKISNLDFHLKLAVLRRQAELYATLRDVADQERWTEVEIAARAERLRARIWAELKLAPPSPEEASAAGGALERSAQEAELDVETDADAADDAGEDQPIRS